MSGLLLCALLAVLAGAAERAPKVLYRESCRRCHDGGVARAPNRLHFRLERPETLVAVMETGSMKAYARGFSPSERRAVAEFLAGREVKPRPAPPAPRCEGAAARLDLGRPPRLDGWSFTPEGTRYVDEAAAGLAAADLPRLELRWAFAFPGARQARSQPAVGGGAVFVGSQDGTVYALNLESGCVRWTFTADAEVRVAPALDLWKPGDGAARPRLYFGDVKGTVYAVDASSGTLLWRARADEHPRATLTGSPRLFRGRLYVPLSSTEWADAGDPAYPCCGFQGGIAAFDAAGGTRLWRASALAAEASPTGRRSSGGAALHGPSGGAVWGIPTVDAKRGRLYAGTGQAYALPADPRTDAVVAFELAGGSVAWAHQATAGDAWNVECAGDEKKGCPGRDLDIGAPPALHRLPSGREMLIVGQKSADVFALDLADGRLLWKRSLGPGGARGGVHWGLAVSPRTVYAPNADEATSGLSALEPETGAVRWSVAAPRDACPDKGPAGCRRGWSAPPTALPGAVLQPGLDGKLRAFAEVDGRSLWEHDTTAEHRTVSGALARGGSMDGAGVVAAEGRVLAVSGYGYNGSMPGGLLLVFGVAQK